jgi:hypothetical protein
MYDPLAPCPACRRHVRVADKTCPFCSAALPRSLSPAPAPAPGQRLTRAAAFVFGATLAVTGCGARVSPEHDGAVSDDAAADGGDAITAEDAAPDAAPDTTPDDGGGVGPLYGGPTPADAGPDDNGGGGLLYGAPVPVDAGPDDNGGGMADYGAPPPVDAG